MHESRTRRLPLAAEDRDVALSLHRGDELPFPGEIEVLPGAPVLIFDGLWLSPSEARDLAYLLIVMAATVDEGVAS